MKDLRRTFLPRASLVTLWWGAYALPALLLGPSVYAPWCATLLAVAYMGMACAFTFPSLLSTTIRFSRAAAAFAALGVGFTLAWHIRELRLWPREPWALCLVAAGLASAHYLSSRSVATARRVSSTLAGTVAAFALLVASLVLLWAHPAGRWHVLRHNKLFGTPLYYLVAAPVESFPIPRAEPKKTGSSGVGDCTETRCPDVIVLLLDTLRADALIDPENGTTTLAHMSPPIEDAERAQHGTQMPFLSGLGSRSATFSNVLSDASWTRAAVASLFTGLPQELHGAINRSDRLPTERLTLAEELQAAGYETAAFVANFAAAGRDAGFAQGFDSFDELRPGVGAYERAAVVSARVETWLEGRAHDHRPRRPVFVYAHYLDPHMPYLSGMSEGRHGVHPVPYDAELRYLDDQLRSLHVRLDELVPERIELIISDHGEQFLEHGEGGHGKSLYREETWVPAILRTPHGARGTSRARLQTRDFYRILLALVDDPSADPLRLADELQHRYRFPSIYLTTLTAIHRPFTNRVRMRAVETEEHLLIWSAYGDTWELYDLVDDPFQVRNLVASNPSVVTRLRQRLPRAVRATPAGDTSRGPGPSGVSETTLDQLRALGYAE